MTMPEPRSTPRHGLNCVKVTKNGKRCQNFAMKGSKYCGIHSRTHAQLSKMTKKAASKRRTTHMANGIALMVEKAVRDIVREIILGGKS